MKYEGTIYRPPSEANSLILQVTIGCAHNKCTFCSMYKDKSFRIRSENEIFKDIETARQMYPYVDKFFLADGNALIMPTEKLVRILQKIKALFPESQRVGIYASPSDILSKSNEDLEYLKHLGLGIVYTGIESGSDKILNLIRKGATSEQIIEAGQKIKAHNIKLSTMLISGLGGEALWEEHAFESARVISAIEPDYIGLLTLLVEPNTQLYEEIAQRKFKVLSPIDILRETHLMINNIHVKQGIFRSNHASNYVALRGRFPQDQKHMLNQLEYVLSHHKNEDLSYCSRSL